MQQPQALVADTYDKAAQVWGSVSRATSVLTVENDQGTTTISRAHKNLTRRAQTLKRDEIVQIKHLAQWRFIMLMGWGFGACA